MNKYNDKYFSILGDSISTLAGYVPRGYRVFYRSARMKKADINGVDDTWWGMVINQLGGRLLVNNSWSGSWVSKFPFVKSLFPSGCSDRRARGLHRDNIEPNVVMIYLGNNDWEHGARLKKRADDDVSSFEGAYELMLKKIKAAYENAEIWCFTICEAYMKNDDSFKYPQAISGVKYEDFNNVIRAKAIEFGCRLIDLSSFNSPYNSIDGEHPTKDGMKAIADMVINSICW